MGSTSKADFIADPQEDPIWSLRPSQLTAAAMVKRYGGVLQPLHCCPDHLFPSVAESFGLQRYIFSANDGLKTSQSRGPVDTNGHCHVKGFYPSFSNTHPGHICRNAKRADVPTVLARFTQDGKLQSCWYCFTNTKLRCTVQSVTLERDGAPAEEGEEEADAEEGDEGEQGDEGDDVEMDELDQENEPDLEAQQFADPQRSSTPPAISEAAREAAMRYPPSDRTVRSRTSAMAGPSSIRSTPKRAASVAFAPSSTSRSGQVKKRQGLHARLSTTAAKTFVATGHGATSPSRQSPTSPSSPLRSPTPTPAPPLTPTALPPASLPFEDPPTPDRSFLSVAGPSRHVSQASLARPTPFAPPPATEVASLSAPSSSFRTFVLDRQSIMNDTFKSLLHTAAKKDEEVADLRTSAGQAKKESDEFRAQLDRTKSQLKFAEVSLSQVRSENKELRLQVASASAEEEKKLAQLRSDLRDKGEAADRAMEMWTAAVKERGEAEEARERVEREKEREREEGAERERELQRQVEDGERSVAKLVDQVGEHKEEIRRLLNDIRDLQAAAQERRWTDAAGQSLSEPSTASTSDPSQAELVQQRVLYEEQQRAAMLPSTEQQAASVPGVEEGVEGGGGPPPCT